MKNITILILFILTISCSKKTSNVHHFDKKLSENLLKTLNEAYDDTSNTKLESFLNEWANRYKPKTLEELSSKEKKIYNIFYTFYCPYDLQKVGGTEWGEINKGIKYLIIQDHININWIKEKDTAYVEYEINDFRPKLNFKDSIKVLYLTAEYDTAINKFLNNDYFPSGTGNFMNPAFPRGKSYTKYEFLRKYLNIFMGHWGNYWHLVTPPSIQGIDFEFPYLTANLHFRLVYEKGEAEFKNYSGKWQMKVSNQRWIE